MSKTRQPPIKPPVKKTTKVTKEQFLTKDELDELKVHKYHSIPKPQETFDLFDDDKSGTIDASEIKKVLEDLGLDQRNPIVYNMVQDLQKYIQPIYELVSGNLLISTHLQILFLNDWETTRAVTEHSNYSSSMTLIRMGTTLCLVFRYIDFAKLKVVAKELGETMNDEELQEMLHHIHVLKKTEVTDQINFEEFYTIITAPRRY